MVTSFSERMANLALSLTKRYGTSIKLTRKINGVFDAATQTETGETEVSDTVYAVLEDYTAMELNGETIQYGDKQILFSSSSLVNTLAPEAGDSVTVFGDVYRAISVYARSSGDSFPVYEVQVRK